MSDRPSVIPTLESVERAWLRKRPRRAYPQPFLDAIEGDGKDGEKP